MTAAAGGNVDDQRYPCKEIFLFKNAGLIPLVELLFIHGRSQQGRTSKELKAEWLDALNLGCATYAMKDEFADANVPFYGDDLADFSYREIEVEVPGGTGSSALSKDMYKRDSGFAELLSEVAATAIAKGLVSKSELAGAQATLPQALHPDEKRRTLRSDEEIERGPLNWEFVHQVFQVLDKRYANLTNFTLRAVLRDVYDYVTNPAIRKKIDGIVTKQLTDQPTIVVGHSLGTVVGYNVLHESVKPVNVIRYISVGSPLGINAIRSKLKFAPSVPKGVGSWFNAYDPRDIVALNPLIGPNFFKVVPPCIEEYGGVKNDTDNRHGISGYLKDEWVARAIVDANREHRMRE